MFSKIKTEDKEAFFDELSDDEKISDPESYFQLNVHCCCFDRLILKTEQSLGDLSNTFEM